jgi:hydrogenase maturation factor
MTTKAIFYHAGCPVCVSAEDNIASAIDPARYDVEIVHLGNDKSRVSEAEAAGVKSVLIRH